MKNKLTIPFTQISMIILFVACSSSGWFRLEHGINRDLVPCSSCIL